MGQAISSVIEDIKEGLGGIVSGGKDILHGDISHGLKKSIHGQSNLVAGGEVGYRAVENHPLEVAAIAAIVLTAGMATPVVAGAEAGTAAGMGAAEAGGAGMAAESLAAGGEAVGEGLTLGSAGTGAEAVNAAAPGSVQMGFSEAQIAGATPGTLASETALPATAGTSSGVIGNAMVDTAEPAAASTSPSGSTTSELVTQQAESEGLPSIQNSNATDPGTMDKILSFAKEHPNIAQGLLTAAGTTLGGAALGGFQYASTEKKAELDKQTLLEIAKQKPELYRQFVQASSSGGMGVRIPFSANPMQPQLRSVAPPLGIIGSRIGTGG